MKQPTETTLVRACLDYLALAGIFAWRNNTTGVYDPARGQFRRFQGLKGVSDILGVLPGGKMLAIECKQPTGRLSASQEEFLTRVRDAGGLALVVWEIDALIAHLEVEGYGVWTWGGRPGEAETEE